MIGGKGNDTFNIKGNVRNFVYDLKATDSTTEKNAVINSSKTKIELSVKSVGKRIQALRIQLQYLPLSSSQCRL